MAFDALDASTSLTKTIPCLTENGIVAVGRYYTKTRTKKKILTADEAKALSKAGIRIWPVYQNTHRKAEHFSAAIGKREAGDALDYAQSVIGQPAGSAIYFSADFDASQAEIKSAIRPHFEAIVAAFAAAGNPYRIGVYGSGLTCQTLLGAGLVTLTWLSQSTGFRGSKDYAKSRRWNLLQFLPKAFCKIDVDPNEINNDHGDFGAFKL